MKALRLTALLLASTAALALDNDNDGMDDLWQQRHGIAPFTGSQDPDGDGRINLLEARNMSHPYQITTTPGIIYVKDLNPVDGLPDAWQQQFAITAAQKFEDPDGDLRTNLEESLVLSHPFVADIPFSLMANRPPMVERPGPDSFIARMPDSAGGRRYILEVSETLLPGSWTTATMMNNGSPYQWGTGDEISAEALTGNAPRMFFRWKIDDPDSDGDFLPDFLEVQIGTNPDVSDSDGDGFADGEEFQQTADPLSDNDLPGAGYAAAERDGTQKAVWFRAAYKKVTNLWSMNLNGSQPPITGASIRWSDHDTPEQVDDYGTYEAKWETQFGELTFPVALSPPEILIASGRVAGLADKRINYADSATLTKNSVKMEHCFFTMGTNQDTQVQPWNVHRRLLAFDRVVTYPDYDHDYSVPRFENFVVPKGAARAARQEKLEPEAEEGKIHESTWMELPVSMKAGEEFAYDSLTHTHSGDPRPWIMLPAGEDREISLSWNAAGGSLGYQAHGPVTPQTVVHQNTQTPSYARPKFKGTSTSGAASLKVGVMKLPSDTPKFVEETFINFAVYDHKQLSVVIHPIALADTSYTPSNIPTKQDAEDYLNSIFKVQANIEVDVTVRGVIPVAYDVGLGLPGLPRGVGNLTLDILWGYGTQSSNFSAEEQTIKAASNPVAGSINVYLVATAPTAYSSYLIVHYWPTTELETAGYAGQLIKTAYEGWAGSGDNDTNNILWVKSRPAGATPSILWTVAHEIGHEMGLFHSAEQSIETSTSAYGGTLRFTDNEARLMTGRAGTKRSLSPKRLIKWEWDTIRGYEFLNN